MADSIYPNVLKTDAQGRVTAEFTGHVAAAGVDLPFGVGATPGDDSKVRWVRANGSIGGYLLISGDDTNSEARLNADGADSAVTTLQAKTAGEECELIMAAGSGGELVAILNGVPVEIFTGAGDSDFAFAADVPRMAYGKTAVTFPGGSGTSNTTNVAHGLGVDPATAQITGGSAAGFGRYDITDSLYIYGVAMVFPPPIVPPAGFLVELSWLAIA